MIIKVAYDITVDTQNIPEDFEEQVLYSFSKFTEGTHEDYTYEDKLAYIDNVTRSLRRTTDSETEVIECMKDYLEHEATEYGNIPDKEDYFTTEYLTWMFERGQDSIRLHHKFSDDKNENRIIGNLLIRVIKVVMNYEKP